MVGQGAIGMNTVVSQHDYQRTARHSGAFGGSIEAVSDNGGTKSRTQRVLG